MLLIRTRIKKDIRRYSLRKKVSKLKKMTNKPIVYLGGDERVQKNDSLLKLITLLSNKV